eukprot:7045208-Pyramimonas_sp.AAC.2
MAGGGGRGARFLTTLGGLTTKGIRQDMRFTSVGVVIGALCPGCTLRATNSNRSNHRSCTSEVEKLTSASGGIENKK